MELRVGQKVWFEKKRFTIIDVNDNEGNPLKHIFLMGNGRQVMFADPEKVILALKLEQQEKEKRVGPKKINVDGSIRKAMTSQQASDKKTGGHNNEYDFASAVNGNVINGQKKADVVIFNNQKKFYVSVKAPVDGKIQVWLYARSHFGESEFGELDKLFIKCIDSFPILRDEYINDKVLCKKRLMNPMIEIKEFLLLKENLDYFLFVSFFGLKTNYLSIRGVKDTFTWHVFPQRVIAEDLSKFLEVENSKTRYAGQFDDQKVILKAKVGKSRNILVNVGEIEMRNDSKQHYREIKFRMHRDGLLLLLQRICGNNKKEFMRGEYKITLYDDAIEELKFLGGDGFEKENQ